MTSGANERVLQVLALAEEEPSIDALQPYLADAAPAVRRSAVAVLTECVPEGAGLALARALGDADATVRHAAGVGLRELREVLEPDEELAAVLRAAAAQAHEAEVRATAVRLLREHGLGSVHTFEATLTDGNASVRREGVAGLVSLDAADSLAAVARDPDPVVRLAVARGFAAIGDPSAADVLVELAHDPDVRVRAAALEGFGVLGCPPRAAVAAMTALGDDAWEARRGAVTALTAAPPETAVPAMLAALSDANLDVRKTAVQALAPLLPTDPRVRIALLEAVNDRDADVRAWARMALE